MKKTPGRSSKKEASEDYEKYLDDVELWDSKQLGADARYVKRASAKENKAVDDALGLQAISIRLQKELVEKLKILARRDGIGYQPYIRQILSRHVREINASKHRRKSA